MLDMINIYDFLFFVFLNDVVGPWHSLITPLHSDVCVDHLREKKIIIYDFADS